MVSHQLDVLRVPRSILGEAKSFSTPKHFSLSSSSRLLSCLFPHPFLFAFCWVGTAKTQAHPAHPALVDTHTWARVLCFFVSDVSGVCSRLFFRCFVVFWFCGFFACLLFSLVTSAVWRLFERGGFSSCRLFFSPFFFSNDSDNKHLVHKATQDTTDTRQDGRGRRRSAGIGDRQRVGHVQGWLCR